MRRAPAGLALLLVAALGLSGCATASPAPEEAGAAAPAAAQVPLAQLTALTDPRSYEGPSTAILPDAAIVPVVSDPVQALPATVISRDAAGDVPVVVADTSRVIAMDLSGSLAAIIWGLGLGETLVARDVSTTVPGTEDLPVITSGGHTVNAESIIALAPTLVITDGSIGPRDVVEQLRDVGITVVFIQNTASFEGAAQLARDVAAVYGAPEAGELLAQRISADVEATRTQIERFAPTGADRLRIVFLYLRGSAGVYYLFGSESGADDLIEGLGAVDVAGELGWHGMQPLTDEAMIAADPDLVLVMTDGLESVGGVDALLETKPAVALTTAGRHRRIVDMADGQILSFGPRSAAVLEALARAVYAPAAGS